MNKQKRFLLILASAVCVFLSTTGCYAQSLVTPTPPAAVEQSTIEIRTDENAIRFVDISSRWEKAYASGEDWGALTEVSKGENTLPADMNLRLLITYYVDISPETPLSTIMTYEPRFSRTERDGKPLLVINSFVVEGDIVFTIDPVTGTLIDQVMNTGGDG